MIDLREYGINPTYQYESNGLKPARVTAVYRERYALICEYGKIYGRLKTSIYYAEGTEVFPTAGDFVLIIFNSAGDSPILKTLPRKSFFRGATPRRGAVSRRSPLTSTLFSSCSRSTAISISDVWSVTSPLHGSRGPFRWFF